jgi:pimeloyl-ACP methyl ester carboxylesterase
LLRDDSQLSVRDWGGRGQSVVLIHGLGRHQREWDVIASELTGQFRVVTYDQRGHGESGQSLDYSWRSRVGDLAALLLELELHDVVLVGHSLGAGVALEVATMIGDCGGLALLDGALPVELPLINPKEPGHPVRSRVVAARRAALHRLLSNTPMSFDELARIGHDYRGRFSEFDQALRRIDSPVLLMLGSQMERGRTGSAFQVVRREAARRAADINPRVGVQWIDARHNMIHTRPQEIAHAVTLLGAGAP